MAKSKIIKDLANGSIDLMIALKRAKVLFSELGDTQLQDWVNFEIAGYPEDVTLPDYRLARGQLIGSYLKGSMATHMRWTNVSLPLGNMPDEERDKLLCLQFREGVDALKKLEESSIGKGDGLGKVISADYYATIAHYNDDPYMYITSAYVMANPQSIPKVFSAVENKLLDVLLLLEKEFGSLDELDIDASSKTDEELKDLVDRIVVLIYNDNSVTIGDGNKIKDSHVAGMLK